jgi:UDP-N-acetylmuramate--alanine ligase
MGKNLKSIPIDVGTIHHVGIGGIGMSGIAEILHNMGYKVSGSDLSENANVQRLRKLGIKIFKGHEAENVKDASVVVKSTAVSYANPEIIAARDKKIPVVRRSEMLAELTKLKSTIAISGSHGKTTTTSIIAHILERSEIQPTVINGGVINSYGSNAKLGKGDWLVAEADESDGTFINIPATIGVITNIDPEHMDYWKDENKLYQAFTQFIKQLPFYGFGVLNIDHPKVKEIADSIIDRKIYTYSMENSEANIFTSNIRKQNGSFIFDINIKLGESKYKKTKKHEVKLPCFGEHNISNTLAAILVCLSIDIPIEKIIAALGDFGGVKRRFTILGERDGKVIVDDYAHHPVEILSTMKAAKDFMHDKKGKIFAVMQPHRYTRLEDHFDDFSNSMNLADEIIITEMYSAGEQAIEGVNQHSLADRIKNNGNKNVFSMDDDSKIIDILRERSKEGDLIVFMGAGTITNYAENIYNNL